MNGNGAETGISAEAADLHRAVLSLREELEAVDFYNQRAEHAQDPELRGLLLHNRNEEIEHAAMLTEWIRRALPEMDKELRDYLFTTKSLGQDAAATATHAGGASAPSFSIGSLKR